MSFFIFSPGIKEEKLYHTLVWKSHNSAVFLFHFSQEGAQAPKERNDALSARGEKEFSVLGMSQPGGQLSAPRRTDPVSCWEK